MNKRILITYATESGSTTEIAEKIGQELEEKGMLVDVSQIRQVQNIERYDVVLVGAPMIMGWHREAIAFLEQNAEVLSKKKVAYFFTSLNLTKTGDQKIGTTNLFIDPKHGSAPKNPDRLNTKEKHGLPAGYLTPVLEKVPSVQPISAAFFGGKLDYSKLSLPAWLFVKLLIRGKEGDYRNWDAIGGWVESLTPAFA